MLLDIVTVLGGGSRHMFLCAVTTKYNLNLPKDKIVSVFCFFMFKFTQEYTPMKAGIPAGYFGKL